MRILLHETVDKLRFALLQRLGLEQRHHVMHSTHTYTDMHTQTCTHTHTPTRFQHKLGVSSQNRRTKAADAIAVCTHTMHWL